MNRIIHPEINSCSEEKYYNLELLFFFLYIFQLKIRNEKNTTIVMLWSRYLFSFVTSQSLCECTAVDDKDRGVEDFAICSVVKKKICTCVYVYISYFP